jgi:hypothetical protein
MVIKHQTLGWAILFAYTMVLGLRVLPALIGDHLSFKPGN